LKNAKINDLNKYDRFYRVVCEPFHQIKITEFTDDLNALIAKVEDEVEHGCHELKHQMDLDLIPYVKFIEHYREKPLWKNHVQNVDSCLMRLLQIDNLFYSKKKLSPKKARKREERKYDGPMSGHNSRKSISHVQNDSTRMS